MPPDETCIRCDQPAEPALVLCLDHARRFELAVSDGDERGAALLLRPRGKPRPPRSARAAGNLPGIE